MSKKSSDSDVSFFPKTKIDWDENDAAGERLGDISVRGLSCKDVYETEHYTSYSYKGRRYHLCHETGKQYRSLGGLKGAHNMRDYWREVKAGRREAPKKPPKYTRGRDNPQRAHGLAIEGYVVPKTHGPVFDYLRRNMANFGVGIIPDDWPSRPHAPTGREEMLEIHKDMLRIIQELYGDKWRIFVRSIGMGQETVDFLENPLKKRMPGRGKRGGAEYDRRPTAEIVAHLRQICLLSLVHVYNIMESTREIEREIWVSLQRTHDIRVLPSNCRMEYRGQVAKLAANIGAMRRVPDPKNPAEMLLMPLRVRALFHHPDLQFDEAIERERSKMMPDYWSDRSTWGNVEHIHELYEEHIQVSDERYLEKKRQDKLDSIIQGEESKEFWAQAEEYWAEQIEKHKEYWRKRKELRQKEAKVAMQEFRAEAQRQRDVMKKKLDRRRELNAAHDKRYSKPTG